MFNGMMDPEMIRLAQEQMNRMSPDDFARIQQQMMANPELMRIATENMKNMRPEDLQRAAEQLNHTRPEEVAEIGEKLANASPEEIATMRARIDAQMNYEFNAAKMLKKQGNELYSEGRFSDALQKYLLAKKNLQGIHSSEGRTLLLACSLNSMSCYLKTKQYDECIKVGSEVLAYDAKNVKALYRRGQAYKNIDRLEEAVSDLSNAHEVSPDDGTIADVLRDAKEILMKEDGHHGPRGLLIEEITEEVGAVSSGSHRSSGTEYLAREKADPSKSEHSANGRGSSTKPEFLPDLKDDPESIRSFQNFISKANPDSFAALSGGKAGEISPDMFKAVSIMINKMSPEELQRMIQIASSFQGENPHANGDSIETNFNGFRPGSTPPNMRPDMLKTASDVMSKMSSEDLQKMFEMESTFKNKVAGQASAAVDPKGISSDPGPRLPESRERSAVNGNNVVGQPSSGGFFPNSRANQQSSFSPSTADLQQMRNQMNDPAMKQMFSSMIKNMSPEMMANMSEQFGINGGLRFATGGGDHKVRIWNMKSVGKNFENDESTQRLLATLRDHFGSVNCVRWAKHGRYIASGSDDQVILIHEKKPGSGTTEFGSGEPPDIENWKVAMTLRGHTADVVDLNWSPDDSILASGSLDNTIHIWNTSTGICTAVLRGHSSLVKGVAWDPIGSFIASQSDDKTVIIWRTSDWSLAHRTDGHWAKSLGSTFFRRLGWSPCGHFITTTHGFQKPRHSAPVLERGEWAATFDFLGHNAPIIVVKFNHSMFRRNSASSQEVKAAPVGWTNGTSKIGGKESQPYNVIAIGSQDRTITVWTTASPRPLFVAKHFFTQSVVDLSWSPDGYSLFACSLDGTVANFHFEVKELGHRLSDAELDELKRSRYGDVRGRQANLAETPAQLLLEAASAKETTTKKVVSDVQAIQAPAKSSVNIGVTTKTSEPQTDNGKKSGGVAGDGLNKVSTSGRISSPVKQREYRRPDGRKRIIPEAVGVPVQQEGVTGGAQSQLHDFPPVSSDHRKDNNGVVPADGVMREVSVRGTVGRSSDVKERSGVTARATITESLVIEKVPASAAGDGNVGVEQSGNVKASGSVAATTTTLSIRVFDKKEGEDNVPVCLEARPREHAVNDIVGMGSTCMMKETEIACTRGSQTLWSDRITGKVTVLAGNINFWAVGCEDGCLQVYTKCGRRAMPTMMMGSAATFIDCDESWKLLLVTRKGSLHVWDLFNRKCLLHDSLGALITTDPNSASKGTIKVISAKLSKAGSPLVVLATRHAFLFDMNLMCWLRVADDCFPASNFVSSWNFGSIQSGELATLQVDVRKYLARKPGWSRVTDDGVQTRAHLEAQLASSLALKSPNEYRQCLLSYIRFLAREADESRLREVCESFLGPPTGMAEAASSNAKNIAWEPCVLGMRKHKLLREDILPAMASNRKVQRLLNEFMDILSEYESTETILDQKDPAPPAISAPPATDQMDTDPPAADKMDTDPPKTDQMDTGPLATDQMDVTALASDRIDSAPSQTDQLDSAPTQTDQLDCAPSATDQMGSTTSAADHSNSASLETDQANSVSSDTDQVRMFQLPSVTDQVNATPAVRDFGS